MFIRTSKDTKVVDSCICGCGGGACVPQRIDTRHVPRETISFNVNGKCGYPLVDALREQYTGLDGKGDKMFADCKSYISLSFEVRPSIRRHHSMTVSNPVCSGYRMRSGQARLVPVRAFHFIGINDSYRS